MAVTTQQADQAKKLVFESIHLIDEVQKYARNDDVSRTAAAYQLIQSQPSERQHGPQPEAYRAGNHLAPGELPAVADKGDGQRLPRIVAVTKLSHVRIVAGNDLGETLGEGARRVLRFSPQPNPSTMLPTYDRLDGISVRGNMAGERGS